jgi:hypothetical protein
MNVAEISAETTSIWLYVVVAVLVTAGSFAIAYRNRLGRFLKRLWYWVSGEPIRQRRRRMEMTLQEYYGEQTA